MQEKTEDYLVKIAPLIGAFLVFLGVLRLVIYYLSFGVEIIGFLDFSEIITSFFDLIIIAAVLIPYGVIQGTLLTSKAEEDWIEMKKKQILTEPQFFRRILGYYQLFKWVLLLAIGTSVAIYFVAVVENSPVYKHVANLLSFFYLIIFSLAIIRLELKYKHSQLESKPDVRKFSDIMIRAFLLTFIVILYSSFQITNVKKGKSTIGTIVQLDSDSLIVSDSTRYYIGKTEGYLFIFNEQTQSTNVYPMDKIKQLTFPIPRRPQWN